MAMVETRYWFLAAADEDQFGTLPMPENVLSIPWWVEAVKWVHEDGNERVAAPMLFASREAAEVELREHEEADIDSFLGNVDKHGEEAVNTAYRNTGPLHVFGIARDSLTDKLEDSDFLCVMVDGRLKLRQDFIEKLRDDA